MLVAATRRGCVHTMLHPPPCPRSMASSSKNCGACVVFPQPSLHTRQPRRACVIDREARAITHRWAIENVFRTSFATEDLASSLRIAPSTPRLSRPRAFKLIFAGGATFCFPPSSTCRSFVEESPTPLVVDAASPTDFNSVEMNTSLVSSPALATSELINATAHRIHNSLCALGSSNGTS